MTRNSSAGSHRDQAGFSLLEVLFAVVVLSVGLMAVANLFAMATSTNVTARHLTAATTQATEVMETLKTIRFNGLTPGGVTNLQAALDAPAATTHQWDAEEPIRVDTTADAGDVVDAYEADRAVDGVGTIRVRWQIVTIDNQTRLLRVMAASASPLLRARSRVEMLTYRSCTGPQVGCPDTP